MTTRSFLNSLLKSVEGCLAIMVYDTSKDPSPILRVGELSDNEINAIKQNVPVFNTSVERVEKLCKVNSAKTIMAFYNHHQIYIFSKHTIVFIIVASSEANAGMILNLRTYLEPMVSEITSGNLSESTSSSLTNNYQ